MFLCRAVYMLFLVAADASRFARDLQTDQTPAPPAPGTTGADPNKPANPQVLPTPAPSMPPTEGAVAVTPPPAVTNSTKVYGDGGINNGSPVAPGKDIKSTSQPYVDQTPPLPSNTVNGPGTVTAAYKDETISPPTGTDVPDPLLLAYTELNAIKDTIKTSYLGLGSVYSDEKVTGSKPLNETIDPNSTISKTVYESTLKQDMGHSSEQKKLLLCGLVSILRAQDLLSDFLFNINGVEKQIATGDRYIAFSIYRLDLNTPVYLTNPAQGDKVINSDKLSPSAYYVLEFVRGGRMYIVQDRVYWCADIPGRAVKLVNQRTDATLFEIVTYPKQGLLLIKVNGMFVKVPRTPVGSPITLSPFIDELSLFRPWNNSKSSVKALDVIRETNENLLRTRLAQLIAGPPHSCSMWISYDMAVAIPTNTNFGNLTLPSCNANDILTSLIQSISLIQRTVLAGRYSQLYKSFGKGFPDDFKFHQVVRSSTAITTEIWKEFYALSNDFLKKSFSSATYNTDEVLRRSIATLAMVLSETVTRDVSIHKTKSYFVDVDLNVEFARYFQSSYHLAFDVSRAKQLNLTEIVNMTQIPWMKNSWKVYTFLPNKPGVYWFSQFLTAEVTNLTVTRDYLFPEFCLLFNLDKNWQAQHSTVGDGVVQYIIHRIDQAARNLDVRALIDILVDHNIVNINVLVEFLCEGDFDLTICQLNMVGEYIDYLSVFVKTHMKNDALNDLSSYESLDLQKYSQLLARSQKLLDVMESITLAKNDLETMLNKMANQVMDQITDSFLSNIKKTGTQLKNQVISTYDQAKKDALFSVGAGRASLKQASRLAAARFDAASKVRPEYIRTLEHLCRFAIKEAIFNTIFTGITSALSVGDLAQGLFKPKSQSMGGAGAMGAVGEIMQFGVSVSAVKALNMLQKDVVDALIKLSELCQKIYVQIPVLESLMQLARPVVIAVLNDDDDNLAQLSEKFQNQSKITARLNMSTLISMTDRTFDGLTSSICQHMNRPGYPQCVMIEKLNAEFFGNMREAAEAYDDVMVALTSIVGGATSLDIAKGSLLVMNSSLEDFSRRSEKILNLETGDKEDREETFIQMRRDQWSLLLSATTSGIMIRISMVITLYTLCTSFAYINAGVAPPTCREKILKYKGITSQDLNELLAFELASKPRIDEFEVTIPTLPSSADDTAYLDIKKLMGGEPHTFKLPQQYEWLKKHNWVNDEDEFLSSTIYIEQLRIVLPPRFIDGNEEAVITVTATGLQDLGPAAPDSLRYYTMPVRTLQVSYTTAECQGKSVESPYAQCGASMNQLCFEKNGQAETREGGNRIALFSDFEVSAKIVSLDGEETGQSSAAYAYSRIATPLLLRATVVTATLQPPIDTSSPVSGTISQNTTPAPAAPAPIAPTPSVISSPTATETQTAAPAHQVSSLRSLARTVGFENVSSGRSSARCCPVGQYTLDPIAAEIQCLSCPAGSTSFLGGLFCIYKKSSVAA